MISDYYAFRKWISIHDLINFSRCPRRFFLSTGCRARVGKSLPMKFGEAIHSGLPYAQDFGLDRAMEEFSKTWGERDNEGDENRNSQTASYLFDLYAKFRHNYKLIKCPLKKPIPDVNDYEIWFILDIGGAYPLVGRMDGLGENRGKKYVLEYKTSRELSDRTPAAWRMSPQIIGYSAVASILFNEHIDGVTKIFKTSKREPAIQEDYVPVTPDNQNSFIKWARKLMNEIHSIESQIQEAEQLIKEDSNAFIDLFEKNFCGCHPYAQFGIQGYNCEFTTLCCQEESKFNDSEFLIDSFEDERPYDLLLSQTSQYKTNPSTKLNVSL